MNERSAAAYIGTPGADPGRANELIHNIVDSVRSVLDEAASSPIPMYARSDTPSELTLETQLRDVFTKIALSSHGRGLRGGRGKSTRPDVWRELESPLDQPQRYKASWVTLYFKHSLHYLNEIKVRLHR